MARSLLVLSGALLISGCANVFDTAPSYLGMATGSIDEAIPQKQPAAQNPAVRHVTSNRVLGAMAFKRTTGAEVDPTTLVGRRQP